MNLSEIISKYDTPGEKFYESVFASIINQCDEADRNTLAFQAERVAFNLMATYRTDEMTGKKRFLYKPLVCFTDSNGVTHISADIDEITPEMVLYWENRIPQVHNPIFKARYAGLVWTFKRSMCGINPDRQIALIYIQSLIDIITENYMPDFLVGIQKAERAIELSKALDLGELLKKAKDSLHIIINKDRENPQFDDHIGIWAAPFRISMEHPNTYTTEEQKLLVLSLQEHFDRLADESLAQPAKKKPDPWLLMNLADALTEFYNKGWQEKIPDLYRKIKRLFDSVQENLTKMQLVGNLENLHRRYLKYLSKEEADALNLQITEAGKGIFDEMQTIHSEVDITNEEMQTFIDSIIDNNNVEQTFVGFASRFIPQQELNKKQLIELNTKFPLIYMFPKLLFDEQGRVISSIGNIEQDMNGHLVVHISRTMKLETLFLQMVIEEGKRRKIFTTDNILAFLHKSPAIKENRYPIIEQALRGYFSGDNLMFVHLLIPQIEAAIRNILDFRGIPTRKPSKQKNAFQLRILDELFRDEQVQQCLTSDFANYLKILLTDNRGWNLRNNVCHGIAELDNFNRVTVDRLLHVLLCLGMFRDNTSKNI